MVKSNQIEKLTYMLGDLDVLFYSKHFPFIFHISTQHASQVVFPLSSRLRDTESLINAATLSASAEILW